MTITDVLDELGIPKANAGESRHVMAGWVGIDCWMCSLGSRKFKLGIRLDTMATTCWSCGKANLTTALMESSGQPYNRVRPLLDALGGFTPNPEPIKRGKLLLPPHGPLQEPHRRYLRSRHFDPDQIESEWEVKGTGPTGKIPWHILIPVADEKGKTVSWTARRCGDKEPRYHNAKPEEESFPAKHCIYGEHRCGHAIIVVEGATGAWRIGAGTGATLGVGFTQAQLLRIAKHPLRVIAFDPEPMAQQRANELCRALEPFPGTTKRIEIDAVDTGEMKPQEVELIRTFL